MQNLVVEKIRKERKITMRTFFYICLLAGTVALPFSENMRKIFFQLANVAVSGVEEVVVPSKYAEVRSVNNKNFEEVINKPDRIVIVDFHQEDISMEDSDKKELDRAIERLPSKVLVAKVIAGKNLELLDRLQIHNLPTLRVYRQGVLLEEYKGKIDKQKFIKVVKHHLADPKSKPHHHGYIGPLQKDWLPEGVEKATKNTECTPFGNLE